MYKNLWSWGSGHVTRTPWLSDYVCSPDSVKSRSDVFYLQPERSCVPDSPVWYSTSALGKEPLDKMLNRVKMVKEINIALHNINS